MAAPPRAIYEPQRDIRWRFYKDTSAGSYHKGRYTELRFVPKRPTSDRKPKSRPSSAGSDRSSASSIRSMGLSTSRAREFSRQHSLHRARLNKIRAKSARRPRDAHKKMKDLKTYELERENKLIRDRLLAVYLNERRRPADSIEKKSKHKAFHRRLYQKRPWESSNGSATKLPSLSSSSKQSQKWETSKSMRTAVRTYRHDHPVFESRRKRVVAPASSWQWPAGLAHLAPAVKWH